MRLRVKSILDMWTVRAGSTIIVCLYAFFTVFVIVFLRREEGTLLFGDHYPTVKQGCNTVDFIVVHIFAFELLLKFLSYGTAFLWPILPNMWEFVDAVVIIASLYLA